MKRNNNSKFQRFVAMILSMSMLLSMPTVVSAAEVVDESNIISDLTPISETSVSREEALKILGMTEEEVGDATIYVMDVPITISSNSSAKSTIVVNSGVCWNIGEVTFTGDYNGSTLIAFNASRASFGVAWKWLNPNDRNRVILDVTLGNFYADKEITARGSTGWGDGEECFLSSGWCDISRNRTYSFEYRPSYVYWSEPFPPIQIWARVSVVAE